MKKQLSKHEREEFQQRIAAIGIAVDKKDSLELVEDENGRRWLLNGQPAVMELAGRLVPHLRHLLTHDLLKKVVVDMGAVKFVTSGADVMRPGIVEFTPDIAKDDLVVIVDVKNRKPLAVGVMLFTGAEAIAAASGKIVKNLHWVGDEVWST